MWQISTEFWKRAVMSKMSRILIAMIRFYRKYISPMKRGCCIYIPTCSQYAIEAIMKYGAVKGSYLAARRILRCHPFAKGGYDPDSINQGGNTLSILVLTQTGGILKPFAIILGFIMNYIYRFLQIFGINNVALTIILFTLVINVLMIPLTVKQQKFSKMSSLMNPNFRRFRRSIRTVKMKSLCV